MTSKSGYKAKKLVYLILPFSRRSPQKNHFRFEATQGLPSIELNEVLPSVWPRQPAWQVHWPLLLQVR